MTGYLIQLLQIGPVAFADIEAAVKRDIGKLRKPDGTEYPNSTRSVKMCLAANGIFKKCTGLINDEIWEINRAEAKNYIE